MNNIEKFLQDISLNTEYKFLEAGKDDAELQKIAKRRGVKLPAIDLAIFKGKYAFTDRTNLNGCSLPKAEVTKSLDTLIGKAIDFDHFRQRIVGFWLDAEVVGDVIYAYGAFFKGNLAEDFDVIKKLMDQNNLGISFEAYGNREFKKDGTYDLKDIEWAGGALLINTKPAFPGAGVLELANKRVLEFASTMKEPDTYIHKIDVIKEIVKSTELGDTTMTKQESTPSTDNVTDIIKSEEEIKVVPDVKAEVEVVTEEVKPVIEEVVEITVDEAIKEAKEEVTKSENADAKPSGLCNDNEDTTTCPTCGSVVKKDKVNKTCGNDESLKTEIATLKEKLVKARDEGKSIGERRSFLGAYAKDMSDDDVLDVLKYENATLKKRVAELETTKTVEKSSVKVEEVKLEIGSKDKVKNAEVDELAKNVRKRAFNL
jgi:hypothetical protein